MDYYSWGQPETDRRTAKRPEKASRADNPGASLFRLKISIAGGGQRLTGEQLSGRNVHLVQTIQGRFFMKAKSTANGILGVKPLLNVLDSVSQLVSRNIAPSARDVRFGRVPVASVIHLAHRNIAPSARDARFGRVPVASVIHLAHRNIALSARDAHSVRVSVAFR